MAVPFNRSNSAGSFHPLGHLMGVHCAGMGFPFLKIPGGCGWLVRRR